MQRPKFEDIETGAAFNNWYWLKAEMVEICKQSGLPHSGTKVVLRERIMYALDHNGQLQPSVAENKRHSKFNWAKADLSLDTVITDNITFGPNFRKFMQQQISSCFSCHSDFMDWVKANVGKTLADAVAQWQVLEQRKQDPTFKRVIAKDNMYNQYTRDFLADNPNKSLKDARAHWLLKKQLPTPSGRVQYESSDLNLTTKN